MNVSTSFLISAQNVDPVYHHFPPEILKIVDSAFRLDSAEAASEAAEAAATQTFRDFVSVLHQINLFGTLVMPFSAQNGQF